MPHPHKTATAKCGSRPLQHASNRTNGWTRLGLILLAVCLCSSMAQAGLYVYDTVAGFSQTINASYSGSVVFVCSQDPSFLGQTYQNSKGWGPVGTSPISVPVDISVTGLLPGTRYHWFAHLYSGPVVGQTLGSGVFVTADSPPSVRTLSATTIDPNTVRLAGSIKSSYNPFAVKFQYGADRNLDGAVSTLPVNVEAGADESITFDLRNLESGGVYYYRIVGESLGGEIAGDIVSFTPTAVPTAPMVSETAAPEVFAESVSVHAEIYPHGADTIAQVEFATSGDFSNAFLSQPIMASGNGSFGAKFYIPGVASYDAYPLIGGLSPGTTYYYRFRATNAVGSFQGDVATFTTPVASAPSFAGSRLLRYFDDRLTCVAWFFLNGSTADYWCEYGLDPSLNDARVTPTYTNFGGPQQRAVNFAALADEATHYARIVARNASGTTKGPIVQFRPRERSLPPLVGEDRVTFRSLIYPNPMASTLTIEYDKDPTFSGLKSASITLGGFPGVSFFGDNYLRHPGEIPVCISQEASGLSPATTYYYRLAGFPGTVKSFTTLAAAPPTTEEAETVGSDSVRLFGRIRTSGQTSSYFFEFGTSPDLTGAATTATRSVAAADWIVPAAEVITGLVPGSVYYFRIVAAVGDHTQMGEIRSFTASGVSGPIVSTLGARVGRFTADLFASVGPAGDQATVCFEYGTHPHLEGAELSLPVQVSGTQSLDISIPVGSLLELTNYYFRAVCRIGGTVQKGRITSFRTGRCNDLSDAISIADTKLYRQLTVYGRYPVAINYTLQLSSDASFNSFLSSTVFSTTEIHPRPRSGEVVFKGVPGKEYYIRSRTEEWMYLESAPTRPAVSTTSLGNVILPEPAAPYGAAVETGAASKLSLTSATLSAEVYQRGETSVQFEYGLHPQLLDATTTAAVVLGGANEWMKADVAITPLASGATHYYRAISRTADGAIRRGLTRSFLAASALAPDVNTAAATLVTGRGAKLGATGNTNDVSAAVWFEYGLQPTLSDAVATAEVSASGSAAMNVSVSLQNLAPGTTYYFRAVARNSAGTDRGSILSFITQADLSTVGLVQASNLTTTSAVLSVEVNPNGGTNATVHFFVNGTSRGSVPTPSGNTPRVISLTVSDLTSGATYSARARVVTNLGTTDGGTSTFVTANPLAPVALTIDPTIAGSSATLRASVNPGGGVTSVSFRYGTTTAMTQSTANQTVSGAAFTPVSASIGSLSPATTYYFRVAAQNSQGTAEGEMLTFTTAVQAPVITIRPPTSVSSRGAQLNAQVHPGGGATSVEFFLNGVSQGSLNVTGATVQTISLPVTGLAANAEYHCYARAMNSAGPFQSASLIFSTPGVQPPAVTMLSTTSVTVNSATLQAAINGHWLPTVTEFFLNGVAVGAVNAPAGATEVSLTVGDLEDGTEYTPSARITSDDGTGVGNQLTGRFTTRNINRPPDAPNHSMIVAIGGTGTATILASDFDGDVVAISVSEPAHGSAAVIDGKFVYTAGATYRGQDQFRYTISDGGYSALGTVFVTSMAMRAAGTYDLPVIYGESHAGNLLLRIERTGSFTGKISIFDLHFVLRGELDATGEAILFLRRVGAPPFRLEMRFEAHSSGGATLELRVYAEELIDDYIVYGQAVADPGELEGLGGERYTVRLPNVGAAAQTPQGDGYLIGRVTKRGLARFNGRLGDGRVVNFGRRLQQNGDLGVGVTIKKGGLSYLTGNLHLARDSEGSVGGTLLWKSFPSRSAYYQRELGGMTSPIGKKYRAPERYAPTIGSSSASVSVRDDMPNLLASQNVVLDADDVWNWRGFEFGIGLRIDRKTGFFRGKVRVNPGDPVRKFQGAVIRSQGLGSGVFLMDGPVGRVELDAKP